MNRQTSSLSALLIGAAFLAGVAGAAWACTGQAEIQLIPPLAFPKTEAAVTESSGGRAFGTGEVTVRIGDNQGPVLARTTIGGDGAMQPLKIVVPDLAPGVYYLIASGVRSTASTAFEVMGPGDSDTSRLTKISGDAWSGFSDINSARDLPASPSSSPAGASTTPVAGWALVFVGLTLLGATSAAVGVTRRRRAPRP